MSGRREGYGEMRGRPEDGKHPDEWTFYAGMHRAGLKKWVRLGDFFRQAKTGVLGSSRKRIPKTWGLFFSPLLYGDPWIVFMTLWRISLIQSEETQIHKQMADGYETDETHNRDK